MTRTWTNAGLRAGAIAAKTAATVTVLAVLGASAPKSQNVADAPSASEGHDVMSFYDLRITSYNVCYTKLLRRLIDNQIWQIVVYMRAGFPPSP